MVVSPIINNKAQEHCFYYICLQPRSPHHEAVPCVANATYLLSQLSTQEIRPVEHPQHLPAVATWAKQLAVMANTRGTDGKARGLGYACCGHRLPFGDSCAPELSVPHFLTEG